MTEPENAANGVARRFSKPWYVLYFPNPNTVRCPWSSALLVTFTSTGNCYIQHTCAVCPYSTHTLADSRLTLFFYNQARPALAWWRSFAKHASAKREEELFAKALGAFTLKTTKTALSRWMEFVAESFEMRALVTGAVGRFVSRTAHAALARWLAWTIDRGERRTLAKRAVSWRMGHLKTAALERWYAWCNDRKEQRALVKTAVYWRMGRVKTETVLRWRDALVDAQVRVAFPKSNVCLPLQD